MKKLVSLMAVAAFLFSVNVSANNGDKGKDKKKAKTEKTTATTSEEKKSCSTDKKCCSSKKAEKSL